MKSLSLVALTLVVLLTVPLTAQGVTQPEPAFHPSAEAMLPSHSYIWQEINGFCAWAATAMAMQYAGVDLDLYDVFAASTIGFSFGYFRYDKNFLIFPGALLTQVEPTNFLADLYGVNYTLYVGSDTPQLEQTVQVYQSEGINIGIIDGQSEALDLMRKTIDSGYPILISVDPMFLPASDYDILREQGLSGGGHGVLVVGYNDSAAAATIIDPGVGSFGDNFGYPIDGRGNYSTISYTLLLDAWSNRYYITSTFFPLASSPESIDSLLGPMIRDKLLGVGTTYFPTSASAYIGKFGQNAFRELSKDLTPSGLESYLSLYNDVEDKVNFTAYLIYYIGVGLEAQVTLQFLSYRTALHALPALMPNTDLADFVSAAEGALPAFEVLANNATLIFPGNLSQATGFVATTFKGISDSYNSSGNLNSSLTSFETELKNITDNLLVIAGSWQAAGLVLDALWPSGFLQVYGPILAFAGAGVGALVIVTFWWVRKKPSQ